MGSEIEKAVFTPDDYAVFNERLRKETEIVCQWFAKGELEKYAPLCCGVELEGWLINNDCLPVPESQSLIEKVAHESVVPELSKFNFELNSQPFVLDQNFLSKIHDELNTLWSKCQKAAKQQHHDVVAVGILPTIEQSMLGLQNMYDMHRYHALEKQFKRRRSQHAIQLDIQGKEHLQVMHHNMLLETVATSLQIHLQVPQSKAVRFYNAALVISAPMIAVCANAPYLFGKSLWEETRVPVFEQVCYLPDQNTAAGCQRVTFGNDFAEESLLNMFLQNLQEHPVLLPVLFDEPPEKLMHFALHNGTIWRWNRPLIGIDSAGPHLRIEHRVAAAGPSHVDVVANVAFFLGLIFHYANLEVPPEKQLSFKTVKQNFYAAAEFGLMSRVDWRGKKDVSIKKLILDTLIEESKKGLQSLGFDKKDIQFYLDEVIAKRVKTDLTGSTWQQRFIQKRGLDFQEMLYQYLQNQKQDIPVCEWDLS